MLVRVLTIALNTYRESVRARILLGLAGVAFAVAFYSIIVGAYTLRNAPRVVSDLGAIRAMLTNADVILTARLDGVLVGVGGIFGNVVRVQPPLVITRPQIDHALDVFTRALHEVSKPAHATA